MPPQTKPQEIEMTPVESSLIAKIGHDPQTSTLSIQFHPHKNKPDVPGAIYHYYGVTPKQFESLRDAESIGGHFGKHIRSNPEDFPFKKIS